jgi:hypothetical protein
MPPTIRYGSRSRSSAEPSAASSFFSAGETTISPAPGYRSTPGGSGARGPSGSTSRPRTSLSRKIVSTWEITRVSSALGGTVRSYL